MGEGSASALCTTAGFSVAGLSAAIAPLRWEDPDGDREVFRGLGPGLDFTPSAKVRPVRWRRVDDSLAVAEAEEELLLVRRAGVGREDWGGLLGRKTEVTAG